MMIILLLMSSKQSAVFQISAATDEGLLMEDWAINMEVSTFTIVFIMVEIFHRPTKMEKIVTSSDL